MSRERLLLHAVSDAGLRADEICKKNTLDKHTHTHTTHTHTHTQSSRVLKRFPKRKPRTCDEPYCLAGWAPDSSLASLAIPVFFTAFLARSIFGELHTSNIWRCYPSPGHILSTGGACQSKKAPSTGSVISHWLI